METNDYGMSLVRTTSFGRKRVALPNICIDSDDDGGGGRKRSCCSRELFSDSERSPLEDLPHEILIKILCGVDHVDLKSLLLVSKTFTDATLIAKQTHFAYSTPRKMVMVGNYKVETPGAPKQSRVPRRLNGKELVGVSVSLFSSEGGDILRPFLLEIETS